jgi:hypothetical protein
MIPRDLLVELGSGRKLNIPNMVKVTQIPTSRRLYKSIRKFSLPGYQGPISG